MADRYPDNDYGRDGRGRFSRSARWGEEDDWRRGSRQRGRLFSQPDDDFEDDRRGYGAYGGGYGQETSGNFAGGYDRGRDWDDDFSRSGGYGGYGQGGMRGQSYGGGGYGEEGSSFSQQGPSMGQGGYGGARGRSGQGGADFGGAQYGQGGGSWGHDAGGGYAAEGGWDRSGRRQHLGPGRDRQQGYGGGYAGMQTGGFGNQTGWSGGYGQGEPRPQDFGGYQGSFGQGGSFGQTQGFDSEQSGGYLTRGGRSQWGRHRGRGPKNYTRSDDRIREDINDRLTDDPEIDASEIDVKVTSCEVTLAGTVDNRDAKRRAEDIAESVSGVKHVQNNLRVQQDQRTSGEDEATRPSGGKKNKSGGDADQRIQ